MKKKVLMYVGIIFLILIVGSIGYLIYINRNSEEIIIEYTPQEEITEEQLRQTVVTLYFQNEETGKLMAEPRQIDAKELIENPYNTIINLLIAGPKNEKLMKVIPDNTVLNNTELIGNCLKVDFSEEFLNVENSEQNELIIKSIVNTLTELVEINTVNITIEGENIFDKIYTREF